MPEKNDKNPIFNAFNFIKFILNLTLALAILISFIFMMYNFFLPKPYEYDDPNTEIQETFPWQPHIFTSFWDAVYLLFMGILRHIAFLPRHVTTVGLISMIGYVFSVLLIYDIRNLVFVTRKPIGIDKYVDWGIGSMVVAIMFIAGRARIYPTPDTAITIFWFSLACLTLYLIHPRLGLFRAIVDKIRSTTRNPKEA